jgi:nicotinate-nucleotide adenylyltransferase
MMKIGICGGTFNPIHNAHLLISEQAMEKYGLDKVLFIPTGNPPHKINIDNKENGIHRLNMAIEAVKSNINFEVMDIELIRSGLTYTIDTLLEIKSMYDKHELNYIIGADVVLDLINWKCYKKVFEVCNFIAFMRPGSDKKTVFGEAKRLNMLYNAKIRMFDSILFDISSSDIRNRVSKGKSIKYLVPDSVIEYIKLYGLYKK